MTCDIISRKYIGKIEQSQRKKFKHRDFYFISRRRHSSRGARERSRRDTRARDGRFMDPGESYLRPRSRTLAFSREQRGSADEGNKRLAGRRRCEACRGVLTNAVGDFAHLHTRCPGIHSRVEDRDDDTSAIVLGVFGEELSDTRLFLRQQAPNRKVTIDDVCHVSNATGTVTVEKPLEMFPLYCRSLIYQSKNRICACVRAQRMDASVWRLC